MKIFELTTGFIAAVVVALGVNHYVNSTKVGEEQIIDKTQILTPQWYIFTGSDELEPTDYQLYDPGENGPDEPDCDIGTHVCAVKATPGTNPNHPDADELEDIIDRNNPGSSDPNEIRYEP